MFRSLLCLLWIFLIGNAIIAQQNDTSINQVDEEGHKIGYWKKFNENGMILYEGTFESDVPIGEFKYFYPDGTTKAKVVFSENGLRSESTTYHYSGKVMSYGFYFDKLKDSLWKYYDINGILLKEEFYRENRKYGIWKSYFDNGQVAEETSWKNDQQHGPWKQYFSDGRIKLEGLFENNEKQGEITYYYPSGRTRITGQYEQSYRSGVWYYMNDSSKIIRIEHYEEGKMIKEETFDQEE